MSEADTAALILRCALGGVMFAHGWNHLYGGGGINGTAGWFGSMGLKWPRLQAIASGLTEMGAGVGLMLGVVTTLQAAAVIGVMGVALVIAHARNGFFIFLEGQGWEYVAFLGAVAAAVAALGPGALSIDSLLGIDGMLDGWFGLALALALGVMGAATLLLTCWRPGVDVESRDSEPSLATNKI